MELGVAAERGRCEAYGLPRKSMFREVLAQRKPGVLVFCSDRCLIRHI